MYLSNGGEPSPDGGGSPFSVVSISLTKKESYFMYIKFKVFTNCNK
jgi:hypothetical protein